MKFTKEQIIQLRQIWAEEKNITIKGANNFGEEFETTGRIATGDSGKVGCYDNVLYVEFGKEKSSPESKQTKWLAPYRTELEKSQYVCELYIFSIECDGKIIYENADKDIIKEEVKKNKQKNIAIRSKDGLDRVVDCPVVNFLRTKIGQPIRIRSLEKTENGWDWAENVGVLYGIEGCTYEGYPIVKLADGSGMFNTFVEESTVVTSVEDDAEQAVVVRNDLLDFVEKREKIQEHINEVADLNQNENI